MATNYFKKIRQRLGRGMYNVAAGVQRGASRIGGMAAGAGDPLDKWTPDHTIKWSKPGRKYPRTYNKKYPGSYAGTSWRKGTPKPKGRRTGLIGQVGASLSRAQGQANKANTRRLQQVLGMYSGMGNAERTRIGRSARQNAAMLRQRLVSRGLGGSTVVGPMLNRVQETANLGYLDVSERVNRAKAGVLERVNDVGPNMGMYASYLHRLMRARK